MKQIKFRAAFYSYEGVFDSFMYWGVAYPSDGINTWLGSKNNAECKCNDQFTGLKDKNGKDIYEGDICKSNKNTISFVVWCLDEWRMNSYYDGGDMKLYSSLYNCGIEVIGNIHENKDLLK